MLNHEIGKKCPMKTLFFFHTLQHGALPGMSDELLGAVFLGLALLTGWQLLKRRHS